MKTSSRIIALPNMEICVLSSVGSVIWLEERKWPNFLFAADTWTRIHTFVFHSPSWTFGAGLLNTLRVTGMLTLCQWSVWGHRKSADVTHVWPRVIMVGPTWLSNVGTLINAASQSDMWFLWVLLLNCLPYEKWKMSEWFEEYCYSCGYWWQGCGSGPTLLADLPKARAATQGWVVRTSNKLRDLCDVREPNLLQIQDCVDEFDRRLYRWDGLQSDIELELPTEIEIEAEIEKAGEYSDRVRIPHLHAAKLLTDASADLHKSDSVASSAKQIDVKLLKLELPISVAILSSGRDLGTV